MRTFLAAAFLSIAALSPAASHAEIVKGTANAFVVRDSVVVKADKREVWLALISPARWWNKTHTFSGEPANLTLMPMAGGCFCERMPGKDDAGTVGLEGSVEHMRVILAIPDQALRLHGGLGPLQSEPVNGVLTVTLAEVAAGTRIIFEYAVGGYMRFETPVIAKGVDAVVTEQMTGLAVLLGPVAVSATAKPAKPSNDDPAEEAAKPSVDDAFGDVSEPR